MTVLLSPHELADCVLKAGFRTNVLQAGTDDTPAVIMTAVCLGESAAIANHGIKLDILARSAIGANVGNWDHGPGQLSGKFQAERIKAHGGNWRDPYVNLIICREIYEAAGGLFTPWHVFTSGTHIGLLPDARIAIANPWPCPVLEWTNR